jgi:plastocyanin
MHEARRSVLLGALLLTAIACGACKDKEGSGGSATTKPVPTKPAPTGSGVIQGSIKFAGAVPAPEPWGGAANADCRTLHPETIQLVKVQDGKLEDAFVYVKAGLPEGSYEAPEKAISVDQKGCEFTPRVFGVMAEQPIEFGNSDAFMHNVKSPEFNQGLATKGIKMKLKLSTEGVMVPVRCDVHPWMRASAGVMSHPYFDVSKADGSFKISGLVDGEYTVAVWHEKLGTKEATIKVAGATPAVLDFELSPK